MYNRNDLLSQIAIMFYEKELTQTDIAKQLGISRPTIASMLKEAKDVGIVKISIQHPNKIYLDWQQKIKEHYQLNDVIIVPTDDDKTAVKQSIGQQSASLIEQLFKKNAYTSLGIGWGTTIYEFVQAASYLQSGIQHIVPLMGGIGLNDLKFHANHLAFQLSEKYQADVTYFYAPAIAENETVYQTFQATDLVAEVLKRGRAVDLAVVGLGNPVESSTYRKLGYISVDQSQEILEAGAVGDILTTFFDETGKEIKTDVSERMIGISLDDLKQINDVVLLASGIEKAESIKALLKNQVIDYLIIDSEIAAYLV